MLNLQKKFLAALIATGAASVTGVASASNNLVENPGFENGNSSWTAPGWGFGTTGTAGLTPLSGTSFAFTGCVGANCVANGGSVFISQLLSTEVGKTYDLSFWLTNNGGPSNEVKVLWGGQQVFDLPNLSINAPAYTQYMVSGLASSGLSTELKFLGRQDPAWVGLDDISVSISAVPEPETCTMLLAGLGLTGYMLRRRKAA